jgi:hypothetical protein
MTTVWMLDPYAAYPSTPNPAKRTATTNMTPERTFGNFFGSFMDSVMGMTLIQFQHRLFRYGTVD